MRPRDVGELLVLAAAWGASFLFMRIAVPAFGPVALAALRVAGATLLLVPLLAWRGELGWLVRRWRPIALVGLFNSALPFLCFAWAARSIESGLSAIFNAASPLFAAIVAWLWLGERLRGARVVGLVAGFAGVAFVASSRGAWRGDAASLAILACLAGTIGYAVSPSLTRRHLADTPPLAVAAGSQLYATVILALPCALAWPERMPRGRVWLDLAALAFVCTGFAYVVYFRLIARVGGQNAIAVTFLVPVFAIAWGYAFLDERIGAATLAGCAVVVAGTALATGFVAPRRLRSAAAAPDP